MIASTTQSVYGLPKPAQRPARRGGPRSCVPDTRRADESDLGRLVQGARDHAAFHPAGKPDQNAYIERFNRTYREEVLSAYLFDSLDEVRGITTAWIDRYNEIRPHDALGSLPPALYRERLLAANSRFRTIYLTGKLTAPAEVPPGRRK